MLISAILKTLGQLAESLEKLDDTGFSASLPVLSGSSIGQHVRHVAEMYGCLFDGLEAGVVCYESRKRDKSIESSRVRAIALLGNISGYLDQPDRSLTIKANFGNTEAAAIEIPTTYLRELAYNLEHTIHHMALIRIGIEAVSGIGLDSDFGVAPSTMRFRHNTNSQVEYK